MLVEKSQKNLIRLQTELDERVDAPVSRGQRLGTMRIFAEEQVLSEIPLVAEETVERLTWWDIFLMLLRRVCMKE